MTDPIPISVIVMMPDGSQHAYYPPTGPEPIPPQPGGLDLRADFDVVSPGPLTTANKCKIWGNLPSTSKYGNGLWAPDAGPVLYDADPQGKYFSILAGGGKTGNNCLRLFYPAGEVGEQQKFYQIICGPLRKTVNLEFDMLFEEGFNWWTDVGKVGPLIGWGGRSGADGGLTIFCIWQSGTSKSKGFCPIIQNQQNPSEWGSNFIVPAIYTKKFVANQWYNWRWQLRCDGAQGEARVWLDGQDLGAETPDGFGNTSIEDNIGLEHGFWHGGGSAPNTDGWVRQDNIRFWTS